MTYLEYTKALQRIKELEDTNDIEESYELIRLLKEVNEYNSQELISIPYLLSKHKELTVQKADSLLQFCIKKKACTKYNYGDGAYIMAMWLSQSGNITQHGKVRDLNTIKHGK